MDGIQQRTISQPKKAVQNCLWRGIRSRTRKRKGKFKGRSDGERDREVSTKRKNR